MTNGIKLVLFHALTYTYTYNQIKEHLVTKGKDNKYSTKNPRMTQWLIHASVNQTENIGQGYNKLIKWYKTSTNQLLHLYIIYIGILKDILIKQTRYNRYFTRDFKNNVCVYLFSVQ